MIKLVGSPYLTGEVHEVVNVPKFIKVRAFNSKAVETVRDGITEAIALGHPVIPIVIDSPGGSVHSLMAILDLVDSAKQHALVATIAEGRAFSCGAALLAAGSPGYRFVGRNATVMVHQSSAGMGGKIHDMKSDFEFTKKLNHRLFTLLNKMAGQKPGYFQHELKVRGNTDWFMSAAEAVRVGLADKIGTPTYVVKVDVGFAFQ